MLPRPYLYVISFCNNTSSNDRSFLADFAKKELLHITTRLIVRYLLVLLLLPTLFFMQLAILLFCCQNRNQTKSKRQQLEIKFSCKVCKEDFVEQYLQLYLYLKANSFIKIQRNSHVNFARKILLNNTYNYIDI